MMENKRQEKTELERDVARLRHLNLLDEQLETQVNCLVLDFGHASHTHMSFLGLNFSCLLKIFFSYMLKLSNCQRHKWVNARNWVSTLYMACCQKMSLKNEFQNNGWCHASYSTNVRRLVLTAGLLPTLQKDDLCVCGCGSVFVYVQQCGLEPVVRVLPTLGKDYSGLAAALDTTCHQIHACGVHIPQDEDLYLGQCSIRSDHWGCPTQVSTV